MRSRISQWALVGLVIGTGAIAAPPAEFTVQGVLRDGAGMLQSSSVTVSVTLYDAPTAGTKLAGPYLFSAVPVSSGLFTVTVSDAALPAILAAATAVHVELSVGNDTFPRQKATSAMFAASAINAQKLGGAAASAYQKVLATPDCGAGKHVQGVAADGAVLCAADPSPDGTSLTATDAGVLGVNFAGTGTASTAARSDHTHPATLSCVQRAGTANVAGGGFSYAACNAGETLVGGGCSTTAAAVKYSFEYSCSRLCLCIIGSYCPPNPSWECASTSAADTTITAYAMCCTTTVQ
jgi:hypothetical protein